MARSYRSRAVLHLNVLLVLVIAGINVGSYFLITVAVIAFVLIPLADEVLGDAATELPATDILLADVNLYVAPLLLILLAHSHAALGARVGVDLPGGSLSPIAELVIATVLVGHQYALVGGTVAHELVHRASNRLAALCACVLLAFTFNTGFLIFHFKGHHRLVGLFEDPATARRGENWGHFLVRTIAGQSKLAFDVEAERLKSLHRQPISTGNLFLSRQLCSVAIAVIAAIIGGGIGLAAFFAAALIGRLLHETVNYVQHYGLIRARGHPVAPRHTWDCGRKVSNALQYNLPLHADHHVAATHRFWQLAATPGAPRLPHGYQAMAIIALLPPLWHRVMLPLLKDWDLHFGTEAERALAKAAVHSRSQV